VTADAGTDPCRAFLAGYPADLLDQVRARLADGSLGADLARRYPDATPSAPMARCTTMRRR